MRNGKVLMKVIPDSKKLVIYDENSSDKSSVQDRLIEFSSLLGITQFLNNCAWVNYENKLYITGGQLSLTSFSNGSFIYDPITNNLYKLADMPTARHSHSMIVYQDCIYACGGYNSSACEKYDIKAQKWSKLSSLISEERQLPVLYVHAGYLYAFFGYRQGAYLDSVEKISLKSNKSKWEIVPFKNPQKIDLKMTGSGIIPADEKEIYILGGKNKDTVKNDAIKYDFSTFAFTNCDFKLDDGAHFSESLFILFNDGAHGLFNNKGDQLLKLQIN